MTDTMLALGQESYTQKLGIIGSDFHCIIRNLTNDPAEGPEVFPDSSYSGISTEVTSGKHRSKQVKAQ